MTSLSEADYRDLSTLPWNPDSSELAEAVRLISGRAYADQLSVVTSLGHLSLTTARTYNDRHHHWHHPQIAIALTQQGKIALSYNPGGERNPKDTASAVVNTPEEAADYVDLLMNRMPYDTERIIESIAKAEEAYERAKTEQGGAGNSASLRSSP